jgi:hypothetical protein
VVDHDFPALQVFPRRMSAPIFMKRPHSARPRLRSFTNVVLPGTLRPVMLFITTTTRARLEAICLGSPPADQGSRQCDAHSDHMAVNADRGSLMEQRLSRVWYHGGPMLPPRAAVIERIRNRLQQERQSTSTMSFVRAGPVASTPRPPSHWPTSMLILLALIVNCCRWCLD